MQIVTKQKGDSSDFEFHSALHVALLFFCSIEKKKKCLVECLLLEVK